MEKKRDIDDSIEFSSGETGEEKPQVLRAATLDKSRRAFMQKAVGGALTGTVTVSGCDGPKDENKQKSSLSSCSYEVYGAHALGTTSIAFNEDGSLLASGGRDAKVKIWNANTGELAHANATYSLHKQSIVKVLFVPARGLVLSASLDGEIHLWDVMTGEQRRLFAQHAQAVADVAVTPDGSTVVSADSGGNVLVWQVDSGEITQQRLEPGAVRHLALSPNGQLLALTHLGIYATQTGWNTTPRIRRMQDLATVFRTINESSMVNTPVTTTDTEFQITITDSGMKVTKDFTVYIHSTAVDARLITAVLLAPSGTSATLWDRQAQSVSFPSFTGAFQNIPQLLGEAVDGVWTLRIKSEPSAAGNLGSIVSWQINAFIYDISANPVFVNDEELLFALKTSIPNSLGPVQRLNINSLQIASMAGHPQEASLIALSVYGGRFVTASTLAPGVAIIWNTATLLRDRSIAGAATYEDIQISADGRRVATANDETVALWDADTGTAIHSFKDRSAAKQVTVPCNEPVDETTTECSCNTVCSCDSVCTCNTVCGCDVQGGSSSHYWYPN